MPGRRQTTLFALAAVLVGWSAVATAGSTTGLASVAPVLLLLAALLLRRYPGERRIASLRARRRGLTSRPRPADVPLPRHVPRCPPRGRLLLARRLAVRPPPRRPAHA